MPEQGAFLKGKLITKNVTLAQEFVQEINRKTVGQNVIFKLDIDKAFDRVEWSFLRKVLSKFGFGQKVISMISSCIGYSNFSIHFNGMVRGHFKSSRGLRQRDTLSLFIFILATEVLSRGLTKEFQEE